MNPFLANTPTGVELAGWLGVLFFLCAGINQFLKFVDRFKEKPPPSETYATIKGVEKMEARLSGEIQRVDGEVKAVDQGLRNLKDSIVTNGEQRRLAIEAKVKEARDAAAEESKELRKEIKDMHTANEQRAVAIHGRLDKLIEAMSRISGKGNQS